MVPRDEIMAEVLRGLGAIQGELGEIRGEQQAQRGELGEVKRQVVSHSTDLSTLLTAAAKIEAVAKVRRDHRARLYAACTLALGAFGASAAGIGFVVRHTLG